MKTFFKRTGKVTADTARRVTGISIPFGGIQWADPGPSDSKIIQEFLIFLEDRRVLFNPHNLEIAPQVEHSIQQIRGQCTTTLQMLPPRAFGAAPIRAIRAAGRRFHDDRNEAFRFFEGNFLSREGTPGFFAALGAFRATVGQQVALLSAHYDIDIEGDLASVLPTLEEP